MSDYIGKPEERNAIITKATLSTADHGVLSAWVQLDYGDSSQGFGGYCLFSPRAHADDRAKDFGGWFIWRVMEIADVTEWGKLPGKTIRVKATSRGVEAIGHIIKNDWFNPRDYQTARFKDEPR